MNKAELVRRVAQKAAVSEEIAERVIHTALGQVITAVADGELVRILGFGTFRLTRRPARNGRNPRTGEAIAIPERARATFAPGSSFKQCIRHKELRRRMFG